MSKVGDHSKIKPFFFWSQKILPLVYDDSLSYYEVLNKVAFKLNEIIGVINDELAEYIRERLDEIYIDASYDEETENIILSLREE